MFTPSSRHVGPLTLAAALGIVAVATSIGPATAPPAADTPGRRGLDPSAGSGQHHGRGPFKFTEVTKGSGVDFTYRNGEEAGLRTILESLGGGVALFDYDGDGRTDLFFPGGGHFLKEGKTLSRGRAGPTNSTATKGDGDSPTSRPRRGWIAPRRTATAHRPAITTATATPTCSSPPTRGRRSSATREGSGSPT